MALLIHADDNGHVCKEVVDALPGIVRGNSRPTYVQKVHKNCARLVQIGTIVCNFDGSVDIPKYKQYQYLEDGTDFALKTDQSRAEQIRSELLKDISSKRVKKQRLKLSDGQWKQVWGKLLKNPADKGNTGRAEADKWVNRGNTFEELMASVDTQNAIYVRLNTEPKYRKFAKNVFGRDWKERFPVVDKAPITKSGHDTPDAEETRKFIVEQEKLKAERKNTG